MNMELNGSMRLLVTSRGGKSGSWAIRGEQLGSAIGASVLPNVSKVDADLAILVKRPRADLLHRLRTANVPIVWDVVDAWPQPDGNSWGRSQALLWLRNEFKTIKPIAIVASTEAMAEDCMEFGVPVLHLPHHARPGQRRNPVRERVQAVGYEGAERYLGHWKQNLEAECERRKWRLLINPPSLADLDIVVAFRSVSGYTTKHWKSNVKLANAQGSGTPCVLNRESGYTETANGGVVWADDSVELKAAFDQLTPFRARQEAAEKLYAAQPRLENIAEQYSQWLHRLKL